MPFSVEVHTGTPTTGRGVSAATIPEIFKSDFIAEVETIRINVKECVERSFM